MPHFDDVASSDVHVEAVGLGWGAGEVDFLCREMILTLADVLLPGGVGRVRLVVLLYLSGRVLDDERRRRPALERIVHLPTVGVVNDFVAEDVEEALLVGGGHHHVAQAAVLVEVRVMGDAARDAHQEDVLNVSKGACKENDIQAFEKSDSKTRRPFPPRQQWMPNPLTHLLANY